MNEMTPVQGHISQGVHSALVFKDKSAIYAQQEQKN